MRIRSQAILGLRGEGNIPLYNQCSSPSTLFCRSISLPVDYPAP